MVQQRQIGRSGLWVSEICVGCMTFGDPERERAWALPQDRARPLIHKAYEAGITFFDTANVYSDGTSEEVMGNVLWDMAPREEIILATKVFGDKRPERQGLSRRLIFQQIDASLKRLKTDHVDLYQIHRWDDKTPIEETMEALHDVVKAGKARYIGASSMYAWQFAKAQEVARANGWTRFISMQNQINLIQREEEREMIPLCLDQGVGLIPWSPMARGRLARPRGVETKRGNTDGYQELLYSKTEAQDGLVIDAVEALAKELGRPMAQVALAWVRQKPGVASPIIGFSSAEQLDVSISGLDLTLTQENIEALEAAYVPHLPVGFG
ncbi:aldo/keto reductase [Tropicimonas sp. IMCC6043]|uniref:aldo/keto reductase n=1 Tax=Tropicimonas sp. IMCC6043 TaxID=2510645 RepID=UPI00101C6816|nr:aldo/keto reductase [Tropicimonas sp. IMCC6043]RYH05781.1 aldo/keto reductase [Tropicimonas sp. IMCC6043]